MVFNEKQFLKSEITKLADKGLINRNQEREILEIYDLKEDSKFTILFISSLIFIGLSLILLISHNWEEIPNALKTFLLLAVLFGTHYGIFYSKTPAAKQAFGVLSGFVLLGNIALLSQIYHLGDDEALAFFSIGIVLIVLAFSLKSFIVFLQGYLFASIGYFLDARWLVYSDFSFDNDIFQAFALLILLGFIIQNGIFFNLSSNNSKLLALINFILLQIYTAEEFLGAFAYIWLPLIFLGFHFKSYRFYSYLALALALTLTSDFFISIAVMHQNTIIIYAEVLLLVLLIANLYFKHYFLSLIMIGALIPFLLEQMPFESLKINYIYLYLLLLLLLGIHCIKENYKVLGICILLVTILRIYLDLIGGYISTSIIFLLFGLGLLYYTRRKNGKKS